MINFTFQNPTRIHFGRGQEEKTGGEIRACGRRILLHYGGGSVLKNGVMDRVKASLAGQDLEIFELGGVQPNPRLALIRQGIALCKKEKIEAILAVGGGSVIDSAKAIAMGAVTDGDVWEFYTGEAVPRKALPIGVVLTIPAAGSESSPGTVVTWEEKEMKFACNNDILRPVFAVMNPEFTFSLPAYQTACGAVDIMAHVMERYFTSEREVDFSDRLCEAALRTMIRNAPRVLENPGDYAARAEVMWTGTVAHNDLLGRGRVEDWASHDIEHELSARYDVAHGAGLAVVFPAWMRYLYKNHLNRFIQFARRVWDVEYYADAPEETAREGIRRLIRFFSSLGMPVTLKELGVTDNRYAEMAAQAVRHGSLGGLQKLNAADIEKIYTLAETGF